MLIVCGLTALLCAGLLLSPGSALGKALRRGLVEAPAHALNRLGRGRIVFFTLLAAAGFTLALLFEAEGLRLFGLMLPDLLVWFAVFDVGVFIDALLIAGTILAASSLGEARARVAALPRMIAGRVTRYAARARRPRRSRARPGGVPGDGDGRGWLPQAAGYRAFSMA
ncbi:hypothetical protein [Brevundimonas sp.]|uniref:hypothetical protein n=1 Tax=Brevundimonas sp. TaxID=1871086 RepID=UPI00272FC785|nr:hypothetical protein [Brevundimonas sp.]MDP1912554.1 hypothetical protein [Brevundimonas sp.]